MSMLHDSLPTLDLAAKPLADLLGPLTMAGLLVERPEDDTVLVTDVVEDSRRATPGALFGALSADTHTGRDGHHFVDAAVANGAVSVLVSPEGAASTSIPLGKGERLPGAVLVSNTRAALAEVAAEFFGRPGDALALIGVTGTNGKTTTAFLLHHALTHLGHTAGLVGTIENRIGAERYASTFTTPESASLQRTLRAMVAGGCTHAVLEVSSHGLALDRVRTLSFAAAVFTNLTQDHLDFHGSAAEYATAKKRLFDGLSANSTAVVNADDPAWRQMTVDCAARVVSFGTSPSADVRVEVIDNALDGLRLRLDGHDRTFRLRGRYNALNLAAAYAVVRALGADAADALDALASAPGVPGRFETVSSDDGVLAVVDYAHTPDALDNVLATAAEIVPAGSRLWAVFGCGGDRDRTKRAQMGGVASRRTPHVVLTSDNPRTESPEGIIDDIERGLVGPAERLADRRAAIRHTVAAAQPGDVIVVAGKGHEDYQIVGTEKRPFDDREELRHAFAARTESTTSLGA